MAATKRSSASSAKSTAKSTVESRGKSSRGATARATTGKSASARRSTASGRSGKSGSARASSRSSAASQTTTDHDQIREWAQARGGKPSCVRGTGGKNDAGLLRIDFPGYSGENSLEEIGWDEFFQKFDEQNLAIVYQDKTKAGKTSNFNKLISRDSVDTPRAGSSTKRSSSSGRKTSGRRSTHARKAR
jgi:hypothetical protein